MAIKKTAGFTILELTFVIGIFSILTMILLPIFKSYNKLTIAESGLANVHKDTLFVMNTFKTEISQAKKVLASRTVNGTLYASASTTIVLEYPVFDDSQNLVSGVSDYGVLYLDPNDNAKIKFSFEAHPSSARQTMNKNLTELTSSLIIRYNSPEPSNADLVTIFVASKDTGLNNKTFSQTSAIKLRNK